MNLATFGQHVYILLCIVSAKMNPMPYGNLPVAWDFSTRTQLYLIHYVLCDHWEILQQ